MSTLKPSLDIFTINNDRILFEIEPDRTLTAVIFGKVVDNTHVELAVSEIESEGQTGVTLSDSGVSFGRSGVWLESEAVDAVFEFLARHDYGFYDARNAAGKNASKPDGSMAAGSAAVQ